MAEERLVGGLYGSEFRRTSNLFGLRCGQISPRGVREVKNAGWYNKYGEKLGWGDLSFENFFDIRGHLREDEIFIVLPEQPSHWNFISFSGNKMRDNRQEQAPGVAYVVENCAYIITSGSIYLVSDLVEEKDDRTNAITITRTEALQLVKDRT